MKIIDAHAHIFPAKIADKAVESISSFYDNTPMMHNGSSEELLKSGEKIGVNKYMVFSTATKPMQVESINDFILDQVWTHKEFIGLGTLHKDYKNYEKELLKLKSKGICGIKLHPDFQKFSINDVELYPVFDMLKELNMFVLTHAGDYRYGYSHPEKIAEIAKMFPELKIIAAHFGGWSQWDIAMNCLNLPNVYFDTSSTIGFSDMSLVHKLLDTYDRTHLFFGTDFPMWDHEMELENLMKTGLGENDLENILYNNFYNFYTDFGEL